MLRNWKRLVLSPVLVLSVVLVACEAQREESRSLPTDPRPVLSAGVTGGVLGDYQLVRVPAAAALVRGKGPRLSVSSTGTTASKLIGTEGGEVSVNGHTLRVPSGAVPVPTEFTLTQLPTGYVEVSLRAELVSSTGTRTDVGGQGFLRPVTLSLSYANAVNVQDPETLLVLRVKDPTTGEYQALPSTVDAQAQTVTTELEHFSEYAVAIPFD